MDVLMRCPCPEKDGEVRHPDGDTVTLRDRLDFHSATTIRKALGLIDEGDPESRPAEVLATLSEFYVLLGVQAWSLLDEKGEPVAVNKSAIRSSILESPDIDVVIEAADKLYNQAILLPLLVRASTYSPPTSTDESTSQPKDSQPRLLRPSKPSSTTTTPTAGTETITSLPDGDSSSSRNSVSAA